MKDEFNKERWGWAIYQWMQGGKERDPAPLAVLLRDVARPIPDFAREFLADLASSTLKRGGRPVEYSGRVERVIASEVFAERKRLESTGSKADPKQAACEAVAKRRNAKPDAIRRLVERLGPSMTYEVWKSIGHPNWSLTP